MKHIATILLFLLPALAFSQRLPSGFPTKTPEATDAIYTQETGAARKVLFSDLKTWILTGVSTDAPDTAVYATLYALGDSIAGIRLEIPDLDSATWATLYALMDTATAIRADFPVNTDAQTLGVDSSGNTRTISISGGNSISFGVGASTGGADSTIYATVYRTDTMAAAIRAEIPINTDSQTLSFASPNLTISGGNTVSLAPLISGLLSGVDSSIFASVYRVDTASAAIRSEIPTNNNQLTNGAGYITGNQTITLSGDVTGSGTTAITTDIDAGAVDWDELSTAVQDSIQAGGGAGIDSSFVRNDSVFIASGGNDYYTGINASSAGGNGIYGGSGTVPAGTFVNITDGGFKLTTTGIIPFETSEVRIIDSTFFGSTGGLSVFDATGTAFPLRILTTATKPGAGVATITGDTAYQQSFYTGFTNYRSLINRRSAGHWNFNIQGPDSVIVQPISGTGTTWPIKAPTGNSFWLHRTTGGDIYVSLAALADSLSSLFPTIYSANSALTGNRTLTGDNYNLQFANVAAFRANGAGTANWRFDFFPNSSLPCIIEQAVGTDTAKIEMQASLGRMKFVGTQDFVFSGPGAANTENMIWDYSDGNIGFETSSASIFSFGDYSYSLNGFSAFMDVNNQQFTAGDIYDNDTGGKLDIDVGAGETLLSSSNAMGVKMENNGMTLGDYDGANNYTQVYIDDASTRVTVGDVQDAVSGYKLIVDNTGTGYNLFGSENALQLVLDQNNDVIKLIGTDGRGLYMDYPSEVFQLGDYAGTNNYTYLEVNDGSGYVAMGDISEGNNAVQLIVSPGTGDVDYGDVNGSQNRGAVLFDADSGVFTAGDPNQVLAGVCVQANNTTQSATIGDVNGLNNDTYFSVQDATERFYLHNDGYDYYMPATNPPNVSVVGNTNGDKLLENIEMGSGELRTYFTNTPPDTLSLTTAYTPYTVWQLRDTSGAVNISSAGADSLLLQAGKYIISYDLQFQIIGGDTNAYFQPAIREGAGVVSTTIRTMYDLWNGAGKPLHLTGQYRTTIASNNTPISLVVSGDDGASGGIQVLITKGSLIAQKTL